MPIIALNIMYTPYLDTGTKAFCQLIRNAILFKPCNTLPHPRDCPTKSATKY